MDNKINYEKDNLKSLYREHDVPLPPSWIFYVSATVFVGSKIAS